MTENTKSKAKRQPMFQCLECGRKFYSTRTARNAMNHRCTCGGCDIDIYVGR